MRGTATAVLLLSCWLFASPVLNAVFILFTLHAFSRFLSEVCALHRARVILLGLGVPMGLVLPFWMPNLQFVPYFAILAINLSMAYVFGHNLLRRRPSVLLQFVTLVHLGPSPSAAFSAYLKQQCGLWFGVGLVSSGVASLALVLEPLRPLASTFLITLLVAQALWFGISHKIARLRYNRPETWQRSMSLIIRRGTWEKLDI